jgi:hypothetical protein
VSNENWWMWGALLLNSVIWLVLAGQVYWISHSIGMVENALLAVAPALLVGPLVAFWFRDVSSSLHFIIHLSFGLLFGLLNTLFSVLISYSLTALWLTFHRHWGHDWRTQGQGLLFFRQEALALIVPALPLILVFLALALVGGAMIGLLGVRKTGA